MVFDWREEGDVNVRHDQGKFEEIAALEQAKVLEVGEPGMLKKGQESGIIDMPLRIEITVPQLNGEKISKIVMYMIISDAECVSSR